MRSSVNATAEDEVIFCEAAYTSPIERIAYILSLQDTTNTASPILFVSTSETDFNLRPWLDLGVQIERISKTRDGYLDLVDLEKRLAMFGGGCGGEGNRKLIGLFSSASRLTGILADDVATTILLHQVTILYIF